MRTAGEAPGPDRTVIELRVLGPIAVVVDGEPVDLGGRLPRSLVAALAAAEGRAVSVRRLVDELWGDEAPPSAEASLASYVSRLRRRIDPPDTPPDRSVLSRQGAGYALLVDPTRRDSHRFQSLLAAGRQALDDGDDDGAEAALQAALACWTDDPPAIDDLPVSARPAAMRLAAERTDAEELLLDLGVRRGRHAELVGRLEAFAAAHPLRERAGALLAVALYRSGRQVEALDAIRSLIRRLDDELGLEPRPELRALEHAVLVQSPTLEVAGSDERLAAGAAGGPPVPAGRDHRRAPSTLTPLVGREHELEAITDRLADHRLVTLWGPGGTGKTRVAIEVAGRSAAWAPMAEVRTTDQVDAALLRALGATLQPTPSTREQLLSAALDGPPVLVVDNAEHVVEGVGPAVAALLDAVPDLRVLATSRVPIGVAGEALVEVAPLPTEVLDVAVDDSPAMRLFFDRAAAVAPAWSPDAYDRAAVDELCRRLDGLPLAVELAAARVRDLAPDEILAGLAGGLDLLAGSTSATPHHRSLDAAISWSCDLLSADDQRLLKTLAAFDGDFDLATASAVAGGDVLDGVARLSASSLLTSDRTQRPRRFRVLHVLREWARAATDDGDAARIRRGMAAWGQDLAQELAAPLRTVRAREAMARIDRNVSNLRRALRAELDDPAGDPAGVLQALVQLEPYFHRSAPHLGMQFLTDAVRRTQAAGEAEQPIVAGGLLALAQLSWASGDLTTGLARSAEAAQLAEAVGVPSVRAIATAAHAFMVFAAGDAGAAEARAAEARVLAEALEGRERDEAVANVLVVEAVLREAAGDPGAALALLDRAAAAAAVADEWPLLLAVAFYRGRAAVRTRRPDHARMVAAEAAVLAADIGVEGAFVQHVQTLAAALAELGEVRRAGELLGAAAAHGRRVGVEAGYADPSFAVQIETAVAVAGVDVGSVLAAGAAWDRPTLLGAVTEAAAGPLTA